MTLSSDTLSVRSLEQYVPLDQEAVGSELTQVGAATSGIGTNGIQSQKLPASQAEGVTSSIVPTDTSGAAAVDGAAETSSASSIWNTPTGQLTPASSRSEVRTLPPRTSQTMTEGLPQPVAPAASEALADVTLPPVLASSGLTVPLEISGPGEGPLPSVPSGAANEAPDGAVKALATTSTPATLAGAAATPNAIVLENQKPGNPQSEWDITGAGSSNIEGFANDISVNRGNTVSFKINTNSSNYRIDIYRLGYYGGMGARKVATLQHTGLQNQPAPLRDNTTGLVDAGNWAVSASWAIPADATSGIYIAKLVRQDGTFGENHIPFIVRDDSSTSDIIFQTSDETWQAYNGWGGANLYGGNGPGKDSAPGRAYKVSYNRPITTRGGADAASGPQDYIFSAEYPALMWLEKNGYDVSYMSGVDVDRFGSLLTNHKMFLSVGHDEYWSGQQRANVEAARDAGVNLSFWSGNEVYWKTRWEPSISADGQSYRTLVTYKETRAGPIDPSDQWTGTWRDPRFVGPGSLGAGQPENSLTGTMYKIDGIPTNLQAITIPYDYANLRFWRNTNVANLQPGQTATLTKNYLGYEWDSVVDNGFSPAGLVALSSTTLPVSAYLLDYGTQTGSYPLSNHQLTLYRAPSGALVFGAGTIFWSWGLDSNHDLTATPVDPRVKQAMVNLLADMGIQPGTLESGLVPATQSTDTTKPISIITAPNNGTALTVGQAVTITGTASDVGGVIAGVEITTDNGATWHLVTGRETWSYSWVPNTAGTFTIRTRAVDDSVNLETPGVGRTVTVTGNNLFGSSATPPTVPDMDQNAIEVGMKFQSSVAGTVTGIRFYKSDLNIGTHIGTLWSSTGTKLATATFTNETGNGWQAVSFSNPVSISPNTIYVVSYHTDYGYYTATGQYFASSRTNGPITAPANAGVYRYGANAFPTSTYNAENYWVDVLFNPSTSTTNHSPVANNDSGFTTTRDTAVSIAASALLANDTDPDGDTLIVTGVSDPTNGTVSFQNNTIIFTPTSGYTGPAGFTYAISDGRGGTASATVSLTVNPPGSGPVSLFSASATPASLSDPDRVPVELGMKFQANTSGTISGIRFYKGTNDTGTHTGTLWTSTGTQLGTLTFTNETASGWQTATFSSPIAISANTTYVVSYHSNGGYAVTNNYFTADVTNGPLKGLASAASGGNGVYAYSANRIFPTSTYNATNYWVDVLFNPATSTNHAPVANNDSGFTTTRDTAISIAASALLANDTDPDGDILTVTGVSNPTNGTVSFQNNTIIFTPTSGYTGPAGFTYAISDGRGGTASAIVSLTVNPPAANQPPVANNDSGFTTTRDTAISIAASALLANDTDPDGDTLTVTGVSNPTNGTVSFQNNTVTFTPTGGYTGPAGFTYAISDGRGGTASATVSLTVNPPGSGPVSLFSASATPAVLSDPDRTPVELGMKFQANTSGTISGIRFYKGTNDTGTHTGSLWTSAGARLGTLTFTNETASGWQTATFSSPITISANTTYVVSYHSNGGYADTNNYFTADVINGPLKGLADSASSRNGVYAYGSSSLFPTNTYQKTNYWVDVLFNPSVAA